MMAMEGDVKPTDFGIAKALDLMYNQEGKSLLREKMNIYLGAGTLRGNWS